MRKRDMSIYIYIEFDGHFVINSMRGVPLASGRDERKKVGKLLISYEKKLSNYRI